MSFLYVISEDDNDDLFYEMCLERITGRSFKTDQRRLRKGGGINAARRALARLLRELSYTGRVDDTFFITSLDNDRARAHPEHETTLDPNKVSRLPKHERDKPCRFCELHNGVTRLFGGEDQWPIKGAVAVPVQMLESWLLLISNPEEYREESLLPLFSSRSSRLAEVYYQPHQPPEQLKDLRDTEKNRLGLAGSDEYCLHCAEALEPDELARRSPSFALFRDQVLSWIS